MDRQHLISLPQAMSRQWQFYQIDVKVIALITKPYRQMRKIQVKDLFTRSNARYKM
jgi:hypothetical protein